MGAWGNESSRIIVHVGSLLTWTVISHFPYLDPRCSTGLRLIGYWLEVWGDGVSYAFSYFHTDSWSYETWSLTGHYWWKWSYITGGHVSEWWRWETCRIMLYGSMAIHTWPHSHTHPTPPPLPCVCWRFFEVFCSVREKRRGSLPPSPASLRAKRKEASRASRAYTHLLSWRHPPARRMRRWQAQFYIYLVHGVERQPFLWCFSSPNSVGSNKPKVSLFGFSLALLGNVLRSNTPSYRIWI